MCISRRKVEMWEICVSGETGEFVNLVNLVNQVNFCESGETGESGEFFANLVYLVSPGVLASPDALEVIVF